MLRSLVVAGLLTTALLLAPSARAAEYDEPSGEPKPSAPAKEDDGKGGDAAAKDSAEKPKPADQPLLDKEVRKELQELIYGPDAKSDDPLENAIRGMRSAKDKMAGKETGKETRDIQKKVIDDLAKLIEQAKNQKPPPSSDKKPQNPNQDKSQDQSKSEEKKPQDDQDPAGAGGQQSGMQNKDKSKESSDQNREAEKKEIELARRRDLIKDVWGHLPPALRQKLLNIASEKSVPKYDDLVRRYFESLAEESPRPPLK